MRAAFLSARESCMIAAVSDGMFALMVHVGLGPHEIRRRQLSFAVVRAETDFHKELHAGDVSTLESTILKLSGGSRRRSSIGCGTWRPTPSP
jgi:acyl-CoA thioesterase FadM